MRLEDQVPSVELCHQLKELGMPQETMWVWYFDRVRSNAGVTEPQWQLIQGLGSKQFKHLEIGAPTVGELGEILPVTVCGNQMSQARVSDGWIAFYQMDQSVSGQTEAETRAKLLIWCAENGQVDWARAQKETRR
jgi:hypothetical protein